MNKPTPIATTPPPSPARRRYLYFTAAITGAAVMVVEILGAKMLSPFVGTSHFVWTAQIAVTLVALACGYYIGGRVADRSQKLNGLYIAILAAAAYLVVTVLICEPVAYWCLDFNLAVGSLLASMILFFIPLALLAITGPFLVRVLTSSVAGVGGNMGRLTAIGTLGSFVGTLLIGYVMLPLLANSTSMYLTAITLAILSGGYFVFLARRPGMMALSAALITGAGIFLSRPTMHHYSGFTEIFRGNSRFGQIQVLDSTKGNYRLYSNDNLIQNTYDPAQKKSASVFTYMLSGLARAYTTNIQNVLCIGMGVGIVPMDFARAGAQVDVVEINPAVVPVAERFFDFETSKVRLTVDDGRHFLNRSERRYDVVVLDAFLGDSSPSHLMTHEAFTSIRHVLRPGGTLVINAFSTLDEGKDFFAASLSKTLKSVFPGVRLHAGGGQIFYAATDHADMEFVRTPNFTAVHPYIVTDVQRCFLNLADAAPDAGRVLTDDYNPVEFFDATNREMVRKALVQQSRRL